MNKKQIKQEFKSRKKEYKSEYRAKTAAAKATYRTADSEAKEWREDAMSDYYARVGKRAPQNPPKRALLEEIGNSVTHGVGSIFAIVALFLMLFASEGAFEAVSAVIYFFGLFAMFTMSCLYHAFAHGSAVKRLFRRFDYSGIYLLIGATFTPPLLCTVGGTFGIVFSAVQWAIIITGISLIGVFGPTRLRFIHIPLYVILGWSALLLFPFLIRSSLPMTLWILAGGVLYTLGIIPFTMKSKVAHFIWHFFVLAGAVAQWIGIYVYIYLA